MSKLTKSFIKVIWNNYMRDSAILFEAFLMQNDDLSGLAIVDKLS